MGTGGLAGGASTRVCVACTACLRRREPEARKHAMDSVPGFEGFQLLRPVAGEDRYFVYTQWATREDFENWRDNRAPRDHNGAQQPVASGVDLLEFEVVELAD